MNTNINIGDPIILVDASGQEVHELKEGDKGIANTVVFVDGQDLILFMPENQGKLYYLLAERFALDEEALAKQQELPCKPS